jgi:anhydro-N-acetylmuramic acid kinase
LKAKTYNNLQLLGLMSGTSLDGLDIAHAAFDFSNPDQIRFQLIHCQTYPLPPSIFEKLSNIFDQTAAAIFELDQELARFYAVCIEQFLHDFKIDRKDISAIASHGQTIFHQPEKGYTTQIGSGLTLNYLTKIPVIDQFRQLDVSAGGQGAPLVPLGDQLLFSGNAEGFLNLGGFANISTSINDTSLAYDICPANLPMNIWMQEIGKDYDKDGQMARSGQINQKVLQEVLSMSFFQKNGPKSLGTEWLKLNYLPLFNSCSLPDKLRTHLELLKIVCNQEFQRLNLKSVYITGGGAFNTFLIDLIRKEFKGELIVPDAALINYKEALIFAFLGARFLRNETTTIAAVTGAPNALRTGVLHDYQSSIR